MKLTALKPGEAADVQRLRDEYYNAAVISINRSHDELMILRVRPDRGIPEFLAGQYTVLGLGNWEPRVANCQRENEQDLLPQRLIKRAYSLSCPMLDSSGQLVTVAEGDYLEFYISLLRRSGPHPPALTPRLFLLEEGDRIFCGPKMHGHYTLENIPRDANILLAATGTGEAPHNAFVAYLLKTEQKGRIVNITCVRKRADLGYLAAHRRLEEIFPNYRYQTLTTREPENVDASLPGFVGKRYLQEYVASGSLQEETGLSLNPVNTHVFLCGNPDMIGIPVRSHEAKSRFSGSAGMVEVLEQAGFEIDQPHNPGNIHFEKYW